MFSTESQKPSQGGRIHSVISDESWLVPEQPKAVKPRFNLSLQLAPDDVFYVYSNSVRRNGRSRQKRLPDSTEERPYYLPNPC
jgi:hypothetical protein